MKDLRIVCQVSYRNTILHAGIYTLDSIPEFKGDFVLPDNISVGPIDCRVMILDKDNTLIDYKIFMAPASPKMISRILNINILTCIKNSLQ